MGPILPARFGLAPPDRPWRQRPRPTLTALRRTAKVPKYCKIASSPVAMANGAGMDRRQKVLHHLVMEGRGLEIGPSFCPFAPKKDGFDVHVLDHLSKEQLVAKYQGHNVALENIEDVDYVWKGEPYAELIGQKKCYDWVIASHVIEHTPDLIAFLHDCDSILKDDGLLSLVVPDIRYHFDCLRPLTGLSKVIDAHERGAKVHSPGTVAEYHLNAAFKGHRIWWEEGFEGELSLPHSFGDVLEAVDKARQGIYVDVHAWSFTPSSFELLLHDLYTLKLSPFRVVGFFPTTACEFYVTLGRSGPDKPVDRLVLLKAIRREMSEAARPLAADSLGKRVKEKIKSRLRRFPLTYRIARWAWRAGRNVSVEK
jgi:hypothetical protein